MLRSNFNVSEFVLLGVAPSLPILCGSVSAITRSVDELVHEDRHVSIIEEGKAENVCRDEIIRKDS